MASGGREADTDASLAASQLERAARVLGAARAAPHALRPDDLDPLAEAERAALHPGHVHLGLELVARARAAGSELDLATAVRALREMYDFDKTDAPAVNLERAVSCVGLAIVSAPTGFDIACIVLRAAKARPKPQQAARLYRLLLDRRMAGEAPMPCAARCVAEVLGPSVWRRAGAVGMRGGAPVEGDLLGAGKYGTVRVAQDHRGRKAAVKRTDLRSGAREASAHALVAATWGDRVLGPVVARYRAGWGAELTMPVMEPIGQSEPPWRLFHDAFSGLAQLHNSCVYHMDAHSGNLMRWPDGSPSYAWIDLGMSLYDPWGSCPLSRVPLSGREPPGFRPRRYRFLPRKHSSPPGHASDVWIAAFNLVFDVGGSFRAGDVSIAELKGQMRVMPSGQLLTPTLLGSHNLEPLLPAQLEPLARAVARALSRSWRERPTANEVARSVASVAPRGRLKREPPRASSGRSSGSGERARRAP